MEKEKIRGQIFSFSKYSFDIAQTYSFDSFVIEFVWHKASVLNLTQTLDDILEKVVKYLYAGLVSRLAHKNVA